MKDLYALRCQDSEHVPASTMGLIFKSIWDKIKSIK
uniref:Uncharacterized protein n=1 Tax=Anguilla anguilla TaxID=7936 RepID=A0A0E9TFR9_ANGAN